MPCVSSSSGFKNDSLSIKRVEGNGNATVALLCYEILKKSNLLVSSHGHQELQELMATSEQTRHLHLKVM